MTRKIKDTIKEAALWGRRRNSDNVHSMLRHGRHRAHDFRGDKVDWRIA